MILVLVHAPGIQKLLEFIVFLQVLKSVKDQTLDSICAHLDSRICHHMIRRLEASLGKREWILSTMKNGQRFSQTDHFKLSINIHEHYIQRISKGYCHQGFVREDCAEMVWRVGISYCLFPYASPPFRCLEVLYFILGDHN